MDWRQNIAETARPSLTEPGAVIVRVCSGATNEVVSRHYKAADYTRHFDFDKMLWGCATRLMDDDRTDSSYYVVRGYRNGQIVVENGWRSVLLTARRPLIRYGSMNRQGMFHIPASLDMNVTLCGRDDKGLSHVVMDVEHRPLAEREGWLCSRCAAKGGQG